MSFKFNPLTGELDLVGSSTAISNQTSYQLKTHMTLGSLADFDANWFDMIDCCELPITTERNILDLGTLDELCD